MTDYTKVPDALLALQTVFRTALGEAVPVSIGRMTDYVEDAYACVGYGAPVARYGAPGVIGAQGLSDWGGGIVGEQFDVQCQISSVVGDLDVLGQLDAALTMFGQVAAALRADPKLGGLVVGPGIAMITHYEWYIEPGGAENGTSVTVALTVNVPIEAVS